MLSRILRVVLAQSTQGARTGCPHRVPGAGLRPRPCGPSRRGLRGGGCRTPGLGEPGALQPPPTPRGTGPCPADSPAAQLEQLELSRGTERQTPRAEKEAQKLLQVFGSGNTEKLLTERHIISLIFKQNSPSIFQNHIEHFRIIDFNGEFCPKINGAIQPKVNCFLVSIFFVQALAMWKTV